MSVTASPRLLGSRAAVHFSAWLALGLAVAIAALSGCSSPERTSPGSGGGAIQELHLFVLPAALPPGQAGPPVSLAVRVFASGRVSAKGVPIPGGTLEILAFDGPPVDGPSAVPAQVWAFPAGELAARAVASSLGTGYELVLPWRGARPAGSRLTLVAQHTDGRGRRTRSAPSVIGNVLRP